MNSTSCGYGRSSEGWLRNDSNNMLEPIWSCGGILPTALVDILETTANEDNGDDD